VKKSLSKLIASLAGLALALGIAEPTSATTIDFETVGPASIKNGYDGLIRSLVDGYAFSSGTAVINLLTQSYSTSPRPVSGQYAGFNALDSTTRISRVDGGVFSFTSVDFGTAFDYPGAPVQTFTAIGYLHGRKVDQASAVSIQQAWNTLTTNFALVDSVVFSFNGTSNTKFVLDNINVATVPEPETYAMLLGGLGLTGLATRRRQNKA
jgi:hypothetical protein